MTNCGVLSQHLLDVTEENLEEAREDIT